MDAGGPAPDSPSGRDVHSSVPDSGGAKTRIAHPPTNILIQGAEILPVGSCILTERQVDPAEPQAANSPFLLSGFQQTILLTDCTTLEFSS